MREGVINHRNHHCRRRITRHAVLSVALVLLTIMVATGNAQVRTHQRDETIDAAKRALIIDRVTTVLNENYVFPDVAKKMEENVRQKLKAGDYDKITSLVEFTDVLTRDLREASKDLHLGMRYAPEPPPMPSDDLAARAALRERMRRERQYDNFGFKKMEILPGNVGYLDLRGFMGADVAGETAIAAMNFLANCDALIIDLRQNGGGDPSMIQLITSYFFDEPVHLNSFYIRKQDGMKQFWTSAYVPGKRLTNADLYVLTSSFTFSAAEEFTYNLKNLKRATIIGEKTGGGAHPVEPHYIDDVHIVAMVPFGRAVNPITGTNWEGAGISPDIQVPADQALETAHLEALKKLLAKTTDDGRKQRIKWEIETTEALAHPVMLEPATLKSYAGSYGPRMIGFENGSLYYQREGRPKFKMIPMAPDTFMLDGVEGFRVKIEKDADGKVIGLIGLYDDGHSDKSPKSSS
jgi:hypothetical protein